MRLSDVPQERRGGGGGGGGDSCAFFIFGFDFSSVTRPFSFLLVRIFFVGVAQATQEKGAGTEAGGRVRVQEVEERT